MKTRKILACMVCAAIGGVCTAGGDFLEKPLPSAYESAGREVQPLPSEDGWWRSWGDPVLDSLLSMAERGNYDVLAAMKRIESASLAVRQTRSGYWPTIQASAGYGRTQEPGALRGAGILSERSSSWQAGLSMNWEVDIFGRIAQESKVKKAQWQSTRAEYAAVLNSLAAQLAKYYVDLRASQSLLSLLNDHIATQTKVVRITEARFEAGISSKLDVAQAKTVLYSTESTLPQVEAAISTDINCIATLVGEYPEGLAAWLSAPAELPPYAISGGVGIPADLLRRRPDVVEAEENLAAAMASVGVARQEWLPTLSVQGELTTESRDIKGLFGKHSLGWSIEPAISWTLFDGLSRDYSIAAAKVETEAQRDAYNLAVMTAVQEVNNAIVAYDSALREEALLQNVIGQASESFTLSLDLYKKGLSPFTDVMNSQEALLEYESQLVSAKQGCLDALVELYQALGGGF